MSDDPSLAEREELTYADVTLNGYRAKISGIGREFARVIVVEGLFKGASFEWSWSSVKHVIETKNGAFRI